eukprot:5751104-Lingulodinium_polyedra.AAC.1
MGGGKVTGRRFRRRLFTTPAFVPLWRRNAKRGMVAGRVGRGLPKTPRLTHAQSASPLHD